MCGSESASLPIVPRVLPVRAIRRFIVRPALPPGLEPLRDLALNLRWSWHRETQQLFASIDPAVWSQAGHDPIRLLGAVPAERWDALDGDEQFRARLAAAVEDLRAYREEPRWYQSLGPQAPVAVGYFSPEYGITHVLPQYSGGLGILAGDHLKAASDLGVPLVAVGLLYGHGYFRQSLSREGWQQERYPVLDPASLPLAPLHEPSGAAARVHVGLPGGRTLAAAVWLAWVGRVPLLMLDSAVEDNEPAEREVTDRLYGGGTEHRLKQEMLLGIGGVRALRLWSRLTGTPAPEVFHTNEGHAGFLGVERLRELVEDGVDPEAALGMVRAGTLFTTHTPVPAGIDRFPVELVAQYLGGEEVGQRVGLDRVLALGAETYPGGDPGVFNMAVMGLRLAQRANGVSHLHGQVSRAMFAGMWDQFDPHEVPIGSVTNGVHGPTWVAPEVTDLAARVGVLVDPGDYARALDAVSDAEIWAVKRVLRARLVADARRRLRQSWLQRGASPAKLGWIDEVLDPDILTIGFARRVPTYKRLTLMLREPDRLRALLLHPQRPVQIVIAGKAHPADDHGKHLIQEMVRFADAPDVRHRIVVLPDYDISMAQVLYPGCDVWLNNPLRPYEACGTSGMKAALNGALNVSILDGWWDEWFDGNNGWAIPSAEVVDDPERRDDEEALALYDLVEQSVAPRFYERQDGLPVRWLEMVRHTLATLGPKVQATRMLADYVRGFYLPAAQASRSLSLEEAQSLAAFRTRVAACWDAVRVDHVDGTTGEVGGDEPALGEELRLRALVSLGQLSPDDVVVQVVHGRVDDADELVEATLTPLRVAESYLDGRHRYEGAVPLAASGPFGYTVRIVPTHPALASIAEAGMTRLPADAGAMTDGDLR
jgi:glycogen phosphorylase